MRWEHRSIGQLKSFQITQLNRRNKAWEEESKEERETEREKEHEEALRKEKTEM